MLPFCFNFLVLFILDIDLEVSSRSTKKHQETKEEITKELEELMAKSEKDSNTEMTDANMVEKPKHPAKVVQVFEEIIRSNKNNIVWLVYQQGIISRG